MNEIRKALSRAEVALAEKFDEVFWLRISDQLYESAIRDTIKSLEHDPASSATVTHLKAVLTVVQRMRDRKENAT
jgi:hypothetical protein